ncbi:MAG: class II glutamine amidotransferase [bacterium]|nr:class II glutamine amidotransferase [bacterium]
MCRFVLYHGSDIRISSLVTIPTNSLIHQSFDNQEREEPLNGDGFGVAWYAPEISDRPALFRSISPAWNNQNLRHLARLTRSRAILAHVRAATVGLPVTELNCHPFSWGSFAFMHNGFIGGFQQIRRALLRGLSDEAFGLIAGSTDSELLFARFVDHYLRLEVDGRLEHMTRALTAAIRDVEELRRAAGVEQHSQLNVALSDGNVAVATRFTSGEPETANSLWVQLGRRWVCEGRDCRMLDPDAGRGAVIISSERLSDDPGWDRVPPNQIVLVGEDLTVALLPIEL